MFTLVFQKKTFFFCFMAVKKKIKVIGKLQTFKIPKIKTKFFIYIAITHFLTTKNMLEIVFEGSNKIIQKRPSPLYTVSHNNKLEAS